MLEVVCFDFQVKFFVRYYYYFLINPLIELNAFELTACLHYCYLDFPINFSFYYLNLMQVLPKAIAAAIIVF